ncbi:MAG: arginine--tRNA ligase [Armatimonadetes bacterium]|nr:arginine--tRNA ligase [Armatimonadota bacterium]
MLRDFINSIVSKAVQSLIAEHGWPATLLDLVELQDTKNPEHGDFACNFALVASKQVGKPPREIGEMLLAALSNERSLTAELAGPGFVNIRVAANAVASFAKAVLECGPERLASNGVTKTGRRVNIEFVSVNPNGPITVGSGRNAAYGDALSRVLEAAGDDVDREYYINDGVNSEQMRLFAESVRHYYLNSLGKPSAFPEKGYKGDYVQDVAAKLRELYGDGKTDENVGWFQNVSQELMIERQRGDLAAFGIQYTTWFSEQSLHDSGEVEVALQTLIKNGAADKEPYSEEIVREGKESKVVRKEEEPGPLWLRATRFGDDKDRVLTRSDGRPAYIAADVAYMYDKLHTRKYDKSMIILGPDHHGYVARMNAVRAALGFTEERFEIVIYQIVRFVKDGESAPMRKRDGNIYELRDLITELGQKFTPEGTLEQQTVAGRDAARWFYLMRSHETHLDFDIDLAAKHGDDNPLFYVQYAHARISGVLRKAAAEGYSLEGFDPALITDPKELALIRKICDLPFEAKRCRVDYGVHRIATYCTELARLYHTFYDSCRVINPDNLELTKARLAVCRCAQIGLQAGLALLGISAPETM